MYCYQHSWSILCKRHLPIYLFSHLLLQLMSLLLRLHALEKPPYTDCIEIQVHSACYYYCCLCFYGAAAAAAAILSTAPNHCWCWYMRSDSLLWMSQYILFSYSSGIWRKLCVFRRVAQSANSSNFYVLLSFKCLPNDIIRDTLRNASLTLRHP